MRTAPVTSDAVLPAIVGAYIISFLIPIEFSFSIGGLLLTPTRLFLLLAAIPVMLLSLSKHRFRAEDGFMLFFAFWMTLSYVYKRGPAGFEISGQQFLETVVSYFVARTFLMTTGQIRRLTIYLIIVVGVLGVLAVPEAITHVRYLHTIPASVTGFYYEIASDTRMGLLRAASTFEHPILFGLFCSSMFSLGWYILPTTKARILHLAATFLATLMSLSSAALLILLMQIGLIGLERVTRSFKKRTVVFSSIILTAVVLIEVLSDRGTVKLIGSYLTFNPHTAYYRVLQWDFTVDDIIRHPFVGIRFEEWTRPFWLTDSIDNQWLLMAMNNGIPAVLAIWAMLAIMVRKVYKLKRLTNDPQLQMLCMGWLIGMMALYLGAWTVSFFGKMQPVYMFLLGIGAAIARQPATRDTPTADSPETPVFELSRTAYTRFPQRARTP